MFNQRNKDPPGLVAQSLLVMGLRDNILKLSVCGTNGIN